MREEVRRLREELAEQRVVERVELLEQRLTNLEVLVDVKGPSNYSHVDSTIMELRTQLNERNQESLLNDVVISGVPETRDENPSHL